MKIGTTELLIVLAVVIIIFGPSQIPKLTKMIGKSVKGFKDGLEKDEKAGEAAETVEAQTVPAGGAQTAQAATAETVNTQTNTAG